MNKTELIDIVSENAEVTKVAAGKMLEAFTTAVTSSLTNGEQVVIPGFGTFSVSNRAARTGRNPQTGEEMQIKASRVAKFKAGKVLKEAVQEDGND